MICIQDHHVKWITLHRNKTFPQDELWLSTTFNFSESVAIEVSCLSNLLCFSVFLYELVYKNSENSLILTLSVSIHYGWHHKLRNSVHLYHIGPSNLYTVLAPGNTLIDHLKAKKCL